MPAAASVCVRIRPLTDEEVKAGESLLRFGTQASQPQQSQPPLPGPGPPSHSHPTSHPISTLTLSSTGARPRQFTGFTHIFDSASDNARVYTAAVASLVTDHVSTNGGTACVFAYGHTGAGKTHTVTGYNDEPGIYRLAVRDLIKAIEGKNRENGLVGTPSELVLRLRFSELRGPDAFDLLAERAKCSVREAADGTVHIRREAVVDQEDGSVRVPLLTEAVARTEGQVLDALSSALKLRSVGSSSVHDQSSRSHALLEIAISSNELASAREEIAQAESVYPALARKRDQQHIANMSFGWKKDKETGKHVRVVDDLLPVDSWKDDVAKLDALEKQLAELTERIRLAKLLEQTILEHGKNHGLGGTLLLADLAGAEYMDPPSSNPRSALKRSPEEIRETKEINTSLLALKECIRSLSSKTQQRVPFRNSKLTLILREHLNGGKNRTVMLANVSPAGSQLRGTENTLRYASAMAGGGV